MLKHVILYKLRDNSPDILVKIKANFLNMQGKIPSLISVECGNNTIVSDRSFDFCLICVFKDRDGLLEYLEHPVHLPVRAFMKQQYEKSCSVDFEF